MLTLCSSAPSRDVGKNFEVTMRMLAKTLSGGDNIIIDDPQILKLNVLRIMINRRS